MTFSIGQRWISNTESQLGLGIITDVSGRHVSISFPAAGEERIYAADNAPLTRIIYKEEDEIFTLDQQKIKITEIHERQGLLFYSGLDENDIPVTIDELSLDCFIKLISPQQRLLSGQFDKLPAFKLRIDTLNQLAKQQQSPARGLLGSRTNHLPHQVYIAHEVAQRYAPRVLLADEVGLGKTIEAGMILHYQLQTGRATRVLIIVPNSLIHQWLVEMIRRFNLYFSIIDQGRYDQLEAIEDSLEDEEIEFDSDPTKENLFETEQLVLCSLDFLMSNEKAREQAIEAGWDLLIVDEAHHLHWSEEGASPEYQFIEDLSAQSKGLLLLTATPEQVGIQSHFARLRLLDPSRFYDLSAFKKEEAGYQALNQLVQQLIAYREEWQTDELTAELKTKLANYLHEDSTNSISETIRQLLDRHGTGRVLFRNTRAAIQGFPERQLQAYPLAQPQIYAELPSEPEGINLYPETRLPGEDWLKIDPRVQWLSSKLTELRPAKVLVICAKASTAIALEQHLKLQEGIRSTSFHEGMSIVERDRSAAYFSEQENGAQTLICSEIGSEGRNFQFAHHLVLFDLPLNPDLLEQRIGRLDRIGQRHNVEIHVPYLLNSAQEKLFRWFNEGINSFEKSCSVGFSIYEKFANQLLTLINTPDEQQFNALIAETKNYSEQILHALQEGRDRLLELNSCNNEVAEELIAAIETAENSLELENYMTSVFQEYGIEHEYHSDYAEILRPTDHMKTSHFPGLKEDGVTVTYSRAKALIREEMEFLSWEHPMVADSVEMILDSELGNVTMVTIAVKGLTPGTLLLESFHTINCAAPKHLQLDRFLPTIPIRILTDVSGKNLTKILDYSQLNGLCTPLKRHNGPAIIKQVRHELDTMIGHSSHFADQQMSVILEQAKDQMTDNLSQEINRLEALQKINPSIRKEEIAFFKEQISESENYLKHATLKLQALRVVINK
ncbi:RNA polymerase-associated protein RapA [Legionella massiliensis]|uniref:RNA polymerase-associated protein RapA n=1 Tax=Legionella massiliensis TaxID=1034943 RepID=A0A078KWZ8_9GAMM|nr:RNA polymerase-associated protein RapA [Legionella massiliensis]CDZ76299.1 RNA polymerase-associated protein RapA [Legionella massiliensis]CEE12037.1 RNA polymerase-associated protein RapA [Legionella massiliensis]